MTNLEVGDVVLCTVQRIEKTSVFVKIEGNGEGSIILSEIAPGRIRNIRNYVVPKKKIVCKVLRISGKSIELSLRRVSQKETKEVMEEYNQEKSYKKIIQSLLKDKSEKAIKEIKGKGKISEFLLKNKNKPKNIEKILGKEATKRLLEILENQKKKTKIITKKFSLSSNQPDGLLLIKELLGKIKDVEIKYLSAGKYTIKIESEDAKKASNKIDKILENLEKKAKENKMDLNILK